MPAVPPTPPAIPVASEEHPIIEDELVARCMNNREFAGKMLGKFQERLTADMTRLVDVLHGQNFAEAARLAHSIKGAAANLAAPGVRAAAFEIEKLSRAQEAHLAGEAIDRLQKEVNRCLGYIPSAIGHLTATDPGTPGVDSCGH